METARVGREGETGIRKVSTQNGVTSASTAEKSCETCVHVSTPHVVPGAGNSVLSGERGGMGTNARHTFDIPSHAHNQVCEGGGVAVVLLRRFTAVHRQRGFVAATDKSRYNVVSVTPPSCLVYIDDTHPWT